ncbi:MAG: CsgG/HfaB family protein [Cyclobacteriaceae bacterium]
MKLTTKLNFMKQIIFLSFLYLINLSTYAQSTKYLIEYSEHLHQQGKYQKSIKLLAEKIPYNLKDSKLLYGLKNIHDKTNSLFDEKLKTNQKKLDILNDGQKTIDDQVTSYTILKESEQVCKDGQALNKQIKNLPPLFVKKEEIKLNIHDYEIALLKIKRQRKKTANFLAEHYYQLGLEQSGDGTDYNNCKKAKESFQKSLSYIPDYKDVTTKINLCNNTITKRIAVFKFVNSPNVTCEQNFLDALSSGIISNLFDAEDTKVIAREEIDKIYKEQKLALSGLLDEETVVEAGKLLGAQYILSGTTTNYTVFDANKNTESRLMAKITTNNKREVEVAASYQLLDVETGKVVYSNHKVGHHKLQGIANTMDVKSVTLNAIKKLSNSISIDLREKLNKM